MYSSIFLMVAVSVFFGYKGLEGGSAYFRKLDSLSIESLSDVN